MLSPTEVMILDAMVKDAMIEMRYGPGPRTYEHGYTELDTLLQVVHHRLGLGRFYMQGGRRSKSDRRYRQKPKHERRQSDV